MLSTMSLCLELASWSSYDTSVWPDKSRNARELLTGSEGIGFKEFAQNEFWNERPTRDSIGVVAANKIITDHKDGKKEYTLIALAIRGGGYGSEWASNFTLGESGTHAGFTLARNNVLKFLKQYIEKYQITGDIKLWVVGYSRAGGTANMVGGALNDGYALPNVTLRKSDLFVYTFEAPQGTLKELVERGGASRYANIHNVINWNDPVPLVAPFQWGFDRYNRRANVYLPSEVRNAGFSSYLSAMLTEFYKLEGTGEHGYQVKEYSMKENLMIDWGKILPGGEPFIWWEESMIPQYDVLSSTVNFLTKDILKSRSHYYHNFEDGVREIFDALYDESGRAEIFWEEFSSGGNLLKIMAPLFNTNPYYTFDRKMRDIRSNINRSVRKAAEEAELDVTDEFVDAMDTLIGDLVEQLALEVLDNNTENINLILKMSELISQGSVGQAHYPEVCLAWLMSFDENYNKEASTVTTPGSVRIIRINCPVDVNVYDDEGFLTASIIDGQRQEVEGGIIAFLNDKGEKILYLPADGSYRIEIEATGDGEMTYSINEIDLIENSVSRLVNYYGIPLTAGDTFTGFADVFADDEMEGGLPDGSSVRYQLLDSSSEEITISEEITGAEVANNYYNVTVVADNDSGYVNGTGTFIKGSFAKVTASPLSGSHLIGWYDGNRLVSTDLVYRFAVTEDMRLTARFAPVTRHALKLEAGRGGAITSVEGFYTVGTQIAVVAEPDAGYVFKGWTSSDNAGEFEDSTDNYTFFIMPDHEVKVTAHFEPVNPIWHTVTVTAGSGGVASGGGRFLLDTQVILTAVPDTGFIFDGWYENDGDLVDAGDVYTFLITEDRVLEARFKMEEDPDETNASEDDNTASKPTVIPETPGTWIKTEDGWQFLGADGIPYRETWIYVSGKWYWIEASAIMAEGWREIQGKRYYLLPVDGAMMTGWHQVEEIWYYFDEKTGMCAS